MLNTKDFVSALAKEGYTHFCVVPCSFATNLINEIINTGKLEYVPCASEAVAASMAAGLAMAGEKPIVLAQSSGLTNMGSCITSLLKPYDIHIAIIVSWRTYKAGDSEVQHEHLATALPDLISAYGYKHEILDSADLTKALAQINRSSSSKTICILQKDTFGSVELEAKNAPKLDAYPKRGEYLKLLNELFKGQDCVFIGTTGNTAREMFAFMPDTVNFYMAGNMGGALSLGAGLAKGGKKVIVCGGDAEFVMHMGGLATAGRYGALDLTYIAFDNEQNKSTGGQNTYQGHLNYSQVAASCGFNAPNGPVRDLKTFEAALKAKSAGLEFLHVKCNTDAVTPRPPLEIVKNTTLRKKK